MSAEQELLHLSLKLKEDIDDDCYNRWDIYYLEKRQAIDDLDALIVSNRMYSVLLGDEKYGKQSTAVGLDNFNQQKKEDAEKRKQGKKTPGAKNKRKGFHSRPDKSKTEKRRAMTASPCMKPPEREASEEKPEP